MQGTKKPENKNDLVDLLRVWRALGGYTVDEALYNKFVDVFCDWYNTELPAPYVYPTADGGVVLEWLFDKYDVSAEIDLSNMDIVLHVLDTGSDDHYSVDICLDNKCSLDALMRVIANLQYAA